MIKTISIIAYLTPRHLTIQQSDANILTYLILKLIFYFVVKYNLLMFYSVVYIYVGTHKKMLNTCVIQTYKILK